VYERLQKVLALIVEDNGGNALVEEQQGKLLFRKLELPEPGSDDDDDDDAEDDDGDEGRALISRFEHLVIVSKDLKV
jgi:hypothetical protein